MATADAINALFLSILARPADAATLAADTAAVSAGMSLAQLAASLANSAEAAGDIDAAFRAELGHGTDPASTAAGQAYLANGGSLAGERLFLAASKEGQADITAAYQTFLGRTPTAGELAVQTYALANGSLTGLRTSLASEQAGIQSLYAAELGRAATAGELATAEAAVTGGQSVAALTGQLANSGEAQADIVVAYQSIFGRTPSPAELSIQTYALANSSLGALQASLKSETTGIQNTYVAILGRYATPGELTAAEGMITGGETVTALRTGLITSEEGQADILALYQQISGNATITDDAAQLASYERSLTQTGSLYGADYNRDNQLTRADGAPVVLPSTTAIGPVTDSVADKLSSDFAATQIGIVNPNAVQIAGERSLLISGLSNVSYVTTGHTVSITPETIVGAPGVYAYNALNGNVIVTKNPFLQVNVTGTSDTPAATVFGFNPSTDLIQNSYNSLYTFKPFTIGAASVGPETDLSLYSRTNIELLNVTPGQLSPANFQYISTTPSHYYLNV